MPQGKARRRKCRNREKDLADLCRFTGNETLSSAGKARRAGVGERSGGAAAWPPERVVAQVSASTSRNIATDTGARSQKIVILPPAPGSSLPCKPWFTKQLIRNKSVILT
jgi:hypothetical protein